MNDPFLAALWFLAFLFSVTCHEAAHAWVAKRGGDSTADERGLVTVDPVPHIKNEPFGMIVAPLVGLLSGGYVIGWGSCPYDPYWQVRHPHRAAWMAAAGPLANLAIAVVSAIALHALIASGLATPAGTISASHLVDTSNSSLLGVTAFLSILVVNNVVLFAFNLLPVPPLDGAAALGIFTSEEWALKLAEFRSDPRVGFLGLFVAWQVMGELNGPIFDMLIAVMFPYQHYR